MLKRFSKKLRKRILRVDADNILKKAITAANDDGIEICGLLVDNGYFLEIVQTQNECSHGGGFSFCSSEIIDIEKAAKILGHNVVGTFHSHPTYIAIPSQSDIENTPSNSFMLIIDVINEEFRLWYIKNLKITNVKLRFI